MANFRKNFEELDALQEIIFEELNKIENLALIEPGDKYFIGKFILFLQGEGEFSDVAWFETMNFDYRDNARICFAAAVMVILIPDHVNHARMNRVTNYFSLNTIRVWEFDHQLGSPIGTKSDYVLAGAVSA